MQRIGILRGGTGDEYFISLKSGAQIMKALNEAGYDILDMLVDREGILHIKGIPTTLETASSQVDVVWNTIHGSTGEDGTIQKMLDDLSIPYRGSGAVASAMTANKLIAKDHVRALGIQTPDAVLVMPTGNESIAKITQSIYRRMAPPWVLKPLVGGASINTYLAQTPLELAQFVEESLSHQQPFLIEQYIYGNEAAVGVINDFRGKERYVLPVVEIKRPKAGMFLNADRTSQEHAVVGGHFRSDEKEQLSALAQDIHQHLGANDYSQSEFIIDKQGKIWYIETDTVPYLTEHNAFVKALQSVGSSLKEFVTAIIGRK